VAVGDSVSPGTVAIGANVVYYSEGSYAEYTAVPAALAAAVPEGVPLEAACALTVQGLTAHYLTRSTVPLTSAMDVVVTAAAGGTGKLVVQMAKMAGARYPPSLPSFPHHSDHGQHQREREEGAPFAPEKFV
jgi:NADPH2:quinone reductase